MGPKPVAVREEKEDVFQAVLLADNFSSSIFGPKWAQGRDPTRNAFGDDDEEEEEEEEGGADDGKKRTLSVGSAQAGVDHNLSLECLIPLANRKLLDYSLEALTVSGVQEVFIYCSSGVPGGNAIKEHVKKSKWSELNVKINVISSEDCESLGDALRDLDAKGMIRNDFILMGAGVITNTALKPLLEEHRRIMKTDKGAVMSLVHRVVPTGHRSRSVTERQAVVVDSATGKVIAYAGKVQEDGLRIPMENLRKEMEVVLNTVDTGITVCSSSVLPLFTDNFDFTNLNDFIKNILMNEEIMGNTIYLHQLKNGYAAKIVDYESFLGVCQDVIQRWTYPLVPDMPFGSNPGERVFQMGMNFVYKDSNVKTARDAVLGPGAVVGRDSVVMKGVTIRNSSIGKACSIGENATITHSQIGDAVMIDNGCKINNCVILDGSHITLQNSIAPNCLIVGSKIFPIQNPTEEDGETDSNLSGAHEEPLEQHDFDRFSTEVKESLHRGFTDNVALDNLALEIQGSRTANFMYFDDIIVAVMKGILGLGPDLHQDFFDSAPVEQWNKTKGVVTKFQKLLSKYVTNEAAETNLLRTIEEYASDNRYFRPMTMQLLHLYYNEDILSQESILKWYKKESSCDEGTEIRQSVKKFIDWLETASEEESEDSD